MARTSTARKTAAVAAIQTITLPELAPGEHYAGIVLADGKPSHHLILLPAYKESATWKQAGAWAKEQKADLPTRQEQSLLFANCKPHIEGGWYWSSEPYAGDSAYAWFQSFDGGIQFHWRKDGSARVRVVRRVPIQ
jgi:hypothetical protein